MALITIRPTRFDQAVAKLVEGRATPAAERVLKAATYGADGHTLLAAAVGFWFLSRNARPRQREAATYLLLNVVVSAGLPHVLKRLVDQERPDRRIHGPRHGIPKSGAANDAFPSGHAVHIGAVLSALTRYFPRLSRVAWPLGIGLAATRILLLAHWTTDVVAGLALGTGIERSLWPWWHKWTDTR